MTRPDSAQVAACLGALGGVTLSDVSTVTALLCAVTGWLYTLWKWRREARKR